jgi:8-oxo-dGTP pyrophosphatase MutT (NUDIX family)
MTGAPNDDEFSVVESEPVYTGKVVSLRRDLVRMSDGELAVREVVGHPGAVGVVAIDENDQVVLVNQYRHPLRARLDELPAGLLDVADEPAVDAAQRELAEEARLSADRWETLIDLNPSPGFSDEAIRIFLARDLAEASYPDDFVVEHEEATMTVRRVPLAEAVQAALDGRITNAAAVAGVLAAEVARGRGWLGLRPADAPWSGRPMRVGSAGS